MALTYGFFDAVYDSSTQTYDRTYSAEQMSMYFKGLVSDGVIANVGDMMQVSAYSGMSLHVGTGRMFVNSRWLQNDTVMTVTLDAAHATLPRIDEVIARLNYANRLIEITVRKGSAAAAPVAPGALRNDVYYEMVLAEVYVHPGTTSITAANITDKRPDQNVCGYVTGLVEQLDTEGMWSQLEDDFGTWFDGMKDQLTTDAAGNLQTQINAIKTQVDSAANDFRTVNNTYVNSYTLNAYKIGRMIFIEGTLNTTAEGIPANTQFARLWSEFIPISEWTVVCELTSGEDRNMIRNLVVDTGGYLSTRNFSVPGNTWARFTASYVGYAS